MTATQYLETIEQLAARRPYWSATTTHLAQLMREGDSADVADVEFVLFGPRSFVWASYENVIAAAHELGINVRIEGQYKTSWRRVRLVLGMAGPLGDLLTLSDACDRGMAEHRGQL